jgi:hypothetical protein
MEKIAVKDLIRFYRKNDGPRVTFINNLRNKAIPKIDKDEKSEGGDYWISCTSAVATIFKTGDKNYIGEKNMELQQRIDAAFHKVTKDRFQKNIDVLSQFEDFDFETIKPSVEVKYLKKSDDKSILLIKGVPVHISPNHVFSFSEKDNNEIGAVWFVAMKDGFTKSELAIFTEVLYSYLLKHYSRDFKIRPEYCSAVDMYKAQFVNYNHILNQNVFSSLDKSIDEFKRFI